MILRLIGAVVLASGSLLKAVAMIVLGLLMGLVGTDVNSGVARYSFDIPELTDGINFTVIASPAISKAKEKNTIKPSVSTSSSARTKGCPKRDMGITSNCWKRCMLVSAVNNAISLRAANTSSLPTSWLWATWPFWR